MGWTSSTAWRTRGDLIAHLKEEYQYGSRYTLVDSSTTGAHSRLWLALEDNTGQRFILLYMIERRGLGTSGEWGYKCVSEQEGPVFFDCPERLLDRTAKQAKLGSCASQWRESVRAYHERRRRQWNAGDACVIHGTTYKVLGKLKPRSPLWLVERDGVKYRASPSTMTRPE